ncbi:MAG TPA: GNAT family N-acetyltransferase [Acidimicrobiia bacterium]
MPEELYEHRRSGDFPRLAAERIADTTVATLESRVVGFVTVINDELEEIYVDRKARGGEVASALLRKAEALIGANFDKAWLAVVAGNERARRFYSRNGWRDAGLFSYSAQAASGRVNVPCHRYEKDLKR